MVIARWWQRPGFRPLKCARRCYGHLAGELGVAQLRGLLAQGCLVASASGFDLTETGHGWLQRIGLPDVPHGASRLAYPCMDWSERRDHLAGRLATALLGHYLRLDWLRPRRDSRALVLTPLGQKNLLPLWSVPVAP